MALGRALRACFAMPAAPALARALLDPSSALFPNLTTQRLFAATAAGTLDEHRGRLKGLYVVARNVFLLLPNCSAVA